MAGWIANGPIALPPRSLAFVAGLSLFALAFVGVGLGFNAAQRQAGAPDTRADSSRAAADGSIEAHPIVELPPAVVPPAPDQAAKDAADDAATDTALANESIAQKSAAAQAVQADAAKPAGNIDEILASPTEKPPAPAKTTNDEAPPPPPAPVKSDVPF